jgi:hypothetical protein
MEKLFSKLLFFGLAMSQFDWPIAKKKRLKLWRLPQNRRFYGKMECLPPLAHLNR